MLWIHFLFFAIHLTMTIDFLSTWVCILKEKFFFRNRFDRNEKKKRFTLCENNIRSWTIDFICSIRHFNRSSVAWDIIAKTESSWTTIEPPSHRESFFIRWSRRRRKTCPGRNRFSCVICRVWRSSNADDPLTGLECSSEDSSSVLFDQQKKNEIILYCRDFSFRLLLYCRFQLNLILCWRL